MAVGRELDCRFIHEENGCRCRVEAIILEENALLAAASAACEFRRSVGGVHLDEAAGEGHAPPEAGAENFQ